MAEGIGDIALSTAWCAAEVETAGELLGRLEETGFRRLELEYRLTAAVVEGLARELRPRELAVVSVHNFCPLPEGMPRERASGDLFNLASTDWEERRLAVRHTVHTLELADRLECRRVVLHLGWVEGLKGTGVVQEAVEAGGLTPRLRELLAARRGKAGRNLDAVSFALERVIQRALALEITLGLENRFHPHQVPDLAELEVLLRRFAGAPVGYWHDTGHGWVREHAGLEPVADWLALAGEALVGCHLHDAVGCRDHLPPGAGELDWRQEAARLAAAPVKVLEIHPGPDAREVARAAELVAAELAGAEEKRQEARA
jgi:sugar phosphate isomerase/epimerase